VLTPTTTVCCSFLLLYASITINNHTKIGDHMNLCSRLTPLLAAAMLLAPPAHAAFKCVVDGQTTYQERPCNDDVKKKGSESVVTAPPRRADLISPGGVVSREENAKRGARVKSEYEPLVRSAFAALTASRMMDYRDMTCLRTRQMLSKPQGQSVFTNDGKVWGARKVQLSELEPSNTPLMLTFKATEQRDPKTTWHRLPQQLFINVSLEIEDGKACVSGFSEWSREIR